MDLVSSGRHQFVVVIGFVVHSRRFHLSCQCGVVTFYRSSLVRNDSILAGATYRYSRMTSRKSRIIGTSTSVTSSSASYAPRLRICLNCPAISANFFGMRFEVSRLLILSASVLPTAFSCLHIASRVFPIRTAQALGSIFLTFNAAWYLFSITGGKSVKGVLAEG